MNSIQLTYGRKKDGTPNAIFDGLNRVVCSFPDVSTSPYGGGDMRKGSPSTAETMKANAALFCAAPELLDALVAAEAHVYEAQSELADGSAKRDLKIALKMIRAAITGAKGGEG